MSKKAAQALKVLQSNLGPCYLIPVLSTSDDLLPSCSALGNSNADRPDLALRRYDRNRFSTTAKFTAQLTCGLVVGFTPLMMWFRRQQSTVLLIWTVWLCLCTHRAVAADDTGIQDLHEQLREKVMAFYYAW
jgi:hypothetical protein